uniref:Uncharacterized protein n=1 Tax=viral metagenome TaxID=1070528 RepID=A0A6C0B702_9ZZZZ
MNEQEEPSKNEYLDKLTMELFLNKSHYAKYLKNTDTKRHDEYKAFINKLKKYAVDIVDITSSLIENPKQAPTLDIEESFDVFVKSIIRHIEMKVIENPHDQDEEEDTLFGQMDQYVNESKPGKSFWSGEQVVKKSLNSDINAFSRSRR